MSQGKKQRPEPTLWISATEIYAHIPREHFYEQLGRVLSLDFIYELTKPLYANGIGRPSLDPVVFFKCMLIGFFENIVYDTHLEFRIADSLTFRKFLGYSLEQRTPDESTLRKTRQKMPLEAFDEVFAYVLALRRQDMPDATKGDAMSADKKRESKASNRDWESSTDPESRVMQHSDGHTHLSYKVDTTVDLETGVIVVAGASFANISDQTDFLEHVDAARPLMMIRRQRGEAPFGFFKQFGGLQRFAGRGLEYASKKTLIAAAGWNL